MRILKHFAMPTTATLVVLWGDQVVGTVSLIRDNAFGLPLEKIFNLNTLRKNNFHIAEVSSLAIDKNFRIKNGQLLFPLFQAVYIFGRDILNVDALVIAVNPVWRDFYLGFYGFKPLEAKTVDNYDFVNGAPAVGCYLDYSNSKKLLYETYNHKSAEQNLYKYLWEIKYECVELPQNEFHSTIIRHYDTKAIREFIINDNTENTKMTPQEQLALKRSLSLEDANSFPDSQTIINLLPRKSYRFSANLIAKIFEKSTESYPCIVHDVSRSGVRLELKQQATGLMKLELPVAVNQSCHITIEPVWQSPSTGLWGGKVLEGDLIWSKFIDYQETKLGVSKVATGKKIKTA